MLPPILDKQKAEADKVIAEKEKTYATGTPSPAAKEDP